MKTGNVTRSSSKDDFVINGYGLMEKTGVELKNSKVTHWDGVRGHDSVEMGQTEYITRLTALRDSLVDQEQLYLAQALDRLRIHSLSNKSSSYRLRMTTGRDVDRKSPPPNQRKTMVTTVEKFRRMRPQGHRPSIFPVQGKQLLDSSQGRPISDEVLSSRSGAETRTKEDFTARSAPSKVEETVQSNLQRLVQPSSSIPNIGRKALKLQEELEPKTKCLLNVRGRLHRMTGAQMASPFTRHYDPLDTASPPGHLSPVMNWGGNSVQTVGHVRNSTTSLTPSHSLRLRSSNAVESSLAELPMDELNSHQSCYSEDKGMNLVNGTESDTGDESSTSRVIYPGTPKQHHKRHHRRRRHQHRYNRGVSSHNRRRPSSQSNYRKTYSSESTPGDNNNYHRQNHNSDNNNNDCSGCQHINPYRMGVLSDSTHSRPTTIVGRHTTDAESDYDHTRLPAIQLRESRVPNKVDDRWSSEDPSPIPILVNPDWTERYSFSGSDVLDSSGGRRTVNTPELPYIHAEGGGYGAYNNSMNRSNNSNKDSSDNHVNVYRNSINTGDYNSNTSNNADINSNNKPSRSHRKHIIVDMPSIVFNSASPEIEFVNSDLSPGLKEVGQGQHLGTKTSLRKTVKQQELRKRELQNLMEDVKELNDRTEVLNTKPVYDGSPGEPPIAN